MIYLYDTVYGKKRQMYVYWIRCDFMKKRED